MIINHKEISSDRPRKTCEKCGVTKLVNSFSADTNVCTKCETGHIYPLDCYDPGNCSDHKMWLG